jgi:hypothetical protein
VDLNWSREWGRVIGASKPRNPNIVTKKLCVCRTS